MAAPPPPPVLALWLVTGSGNYLGSYTVVVTTTEDRARTLGAAALRAYYGKPQDIDAVRCLGPVELGAAHVVWDGDY